MTSDTATPAPPSTASPVRVAGAIAQLAALGVIGPVIFSLLFGLLGLGLGLLPLFRIGLLLLVAFVYAIFALGWRRGGDRRRAAHRLRGARPRRRARPRED